MINLQGLLVRIERLEARLDNQASSVVDYTTLAKTSADGSRDEATVTANDTENQRPLLRTNPWGLAARPVVDVGVAIVKAMAGSFGGMLVGIFSTKHGPQNLEEGETSLYCKTDGTRVWLDKDGKIHIDAASAQDIIFNGGSLKVARKTDTVKVTIPASSFLISAVGGGTLNPDPVEVDGEITSGAEHVLG